MAANTTPVETQTDLIRIDLANTINLDQRIKNDCDTKGAAGYELKAAFEKNNQLILIFQLTR